MSEADILKTRPSLRKLFCVCTYHYAARRSSDLVRRSINLNLLKRNQMRRLVNTKKSVSNKLIILLSISLLLCILSEASLSLHSSATFSQVMRRVRLPFFTWGNKVVVSSVLCCTFIYLFIMNYPPRPPLFLSGTKQIILPAFLAQSSPSSSSSSASIHHASA